MWLMIIIQILNGIDLPGHGPRKLPAPKMFVAVIVLWSIFGLLVDAGQARAAKIMAWAAVLVALLGPPLAAGVVPGANATGASPAGTTLLNLLKTISKNFGTTPTGTAVSPTQGGTVA
jgi:hypothetical protein